MSVYEPIINNQIRKVYQYSFKKYCGQSLFSIIERLELDSGNTINLFRLPFDDNNIAGFVGYKNNKFVIFTNTNKTLGYEIFTLAHEIYHLLENHVSVKANIVLEEGGDFRTESDDLADRFATELLMPGDVIRNDFMKVMSENNLEIPDYKLIIQLQQDYYVEYKAITKRLRELNLIDQDLEQTLNKISENKNELEIATKKLGYSSKLNEPSRDIYLPKRFLRIIDENYKKHDTNYDDLTVLFGYCNLTPEDFGYEEDHSLSPEAIAYMEQLENRLGCE